MSCPISIPCFDYTNDFEKKVVNSTIIYNETEQVTMFMLPRMCKGDYNLCDFVEKINIICATKEQDVQWIVDSLVYYNEVTDTYHLNDSTAGNLVGITLFDMEENEVVVIDSDIPEDCIFELTIVQKQVNKDIRDYKFCMFKLQCEYAKQVIKYLACLKHGLDITKSFAKLIENKRLLILLNQYDVRDIKYNTKSYNQFTFTEIKQLISKIKY